MKAASQAMENQPLMSIKILKGDNAEAATQVQKNLEEFLATPPDVGRQGRRPSIYRVPEHMRSKSKPEDYKPKLVSFGPYHHGDPQLLPMEEHKYRAFRDFLTDCNVESIVKRVSNKLEELQGSYDKLDAKWTDDPAKFLQLMIVDGCFMFRVLTFTVPEPDASDPIFSSHGELHIFPVILRDMLLLENQLPMVLLDELCSIKSPNQKVQSLVFRYFFPGDKNERPGEYLHSLHLYKAILFQPSKQPERVDEPQVDNESQIIRSATELREAGVRFRTKESRTSMDISFDTKTGVLSFPPIIVDDLTCSSYLNLMAFEKLHVGAGNEVTSYIYFIDNLIDVDKDVALLTYHKVMVNAIGNDQTAAELFNQLAEGANMDPCSPLNKVHTLVNRHCSRQCNEWCANLRHTYFQNPWTIISLVAALLGFGIVILQTTYDIYGYHRPRR